MQIKFDFARKYNYFCCITSKFCGYSAKIKVAFSSTKTSSFNLFYFCFERYLVDIYSTKKVGFSIKQQRNEKYHNATFDVRGCKKNIAKFFLHKGIERSSN